MKFSRAIDDYVIDRRSQGSINSPNTERAYREKLNVFCDPAMPGLLPGLPGGPEYVPAAVQEAIMEDVLDAVGAMTPAMTRRVSDSERWGIPATAPALRFVTEDAPDGLGRGVVFGEFTDAPAPRPRLILPDDLPVSGAGVILP